MELITPTFSRSCGLELCGVELTDWSNIRYTFCDPQGGFLLEAIPIQVIKEVLFQKEVH